MTNCYTVTPNGVTEGIAFFRGPVYAHPARTEDPKYAAWPAVWLGGDERNGRDRVKRVLIESAPAGNLLTDASMKCDGKKPAYLVAGEPEHVFVYVRTGFPTEEGVHYAFQQVNCVNKKETGSGRNDFGSWTYVVEGATKPKVCAFDELWHLQEGAELEIEFANGVFRRYFVKDGKLVSEIIKPVAAQPPVEKFTSPPVVKTRRSTLTLRSLADLGPARTAAA